MSGGVRRTALPLMRRAPDRARFAEHQTEDGRRVFVAKSVLSDLARLERLDHPIETACLLFGGFFTDGKRACAIVTKLIFPEPGEVIGNRSMVTLTADGVEQMIARAWLEDPLLKPLGWGHTHPLFEAYFSHVDREEQGVWTEPTSVGIVISGLETPQARYRVFVGPESEPADPVVPPAEQSPPRAEQRPTAPREPARIAQIKRAGVRKTYLAAAIVAIVALLIALLLTWVAGPGAEGQAGATRRPIERVERSGVPRPSSLEERVIGLGGLRR